MNTTHTEGRMIILSAPSGAGKSTIAGHLLRTADLKLQFSVSACSREKRPNEVDGRDYFFLTVDQFRQKIGNKEFIEWEEVYQDHFYGTLRSEPERIWSAGHNVLFDVDVQGGINLKRLFGLRALSVFIMPPSLEVLEERLRNRGTDPEDRILKRIAKAGAEMEFAARFDHVIINDKLDRALREAEQLARNFLLT